MRAIDVIGLQAADISQGTGPIKGKPRGQGAATICSQPGREDGRNDTRHRFSDDGIVKVKRPPIDRGPQARNLENRPDIISLGLFWL